MIYFNLINNIWDWNFEKHFYHSNLTHHRLMTTDITHESLPKTDDVLSINDGFVFVSYFLIYMCCVCFLCGNTL